MTLAELRSRFAHARGLPFKDRRRAVDKLLREAFTSGLLEDKVGWDGIHKGSPIVGEASHQMKLAPWRDSFMRAIPLPVREGLLATALGYSGGIDALDVAKAILAPIRYSVRDAKTTTGYRFGWPAKWDQPATERWLTETLTETAPVTAAELTLEMPASEATATKADEVRVDMLVTIHDRLTTIVIGKLDESFARHVINGVSAWVRLHIVTSLVRLDPIPTSADLNTAWSMIEVRDRSMSDAELEAFYTKDFGRLDVPDSWFTMASDGISEVTKRLKDERKSKAASHTSTLEKVISDETKEVSMTATATPAFDTDLAIKVVEPMLPVITGGKITKVSDLHSMMKVAGESLAVIDKLNGEVEELKGKLASTAVSTVRYAVGEIGRSSTDTFPTGRLVMAKAREVFGLSGEMGKRFDFDVPMYEWDAPHPLVPELDQDYIFEKKNLALALDALVAGDNAWMYGHTGSGKTTFFEQIAARLNWPVVRVNGDSDISRFELVGKTDFKDGATTFTPGVLVTALEQGAMLLMDEFDVTRSETSYILNRMLENRGLLLLEDGGRFVAPHPTFRIVAACNSRGNGDEYGIYPAVRTQSAATRSRFTVWIEHDYLKPEQETKLLMSKTNIVKDMADKWVRLANEVREAFKRGQVLEVISPRELLAACTRYQRLTVRIGDQKEALKMAIEAAVLSRCSASDRAAIAEMTQRVFGV